MRLSGGALAATALAVVSAAVPTTAAAADPARWAETGRSAIPLQYYQGVTSDPERNFYFSGHVGLYRTDSALRETARNDDAIPPQVHLTEGYNHIGDLSWDAAEGGRLLLPLECYYPGLPNGGNTCGFSASGQAELGTGSIGVADPRTLAWRYYVKLDERDIRKAMWNEVSPDGQLIWTSSGQDLLAYSAAQVNPANAAPTGPKIRPVRRLRAAVPPSGITGATFVGERLFLAGQNGPAFQVWSVDLATGARELEIEREIVGESEGLDTADALGGILHWQIQPYNEEAVPTYGVANGTLLHFRPRSELPPGELAPPAPCCAPPGSPPPGSQPPPAGGQPPPAAPGAAPSSAPPGRVRLSITPRRAVQGRRVRFRIRTTVMRGGRAVAVPAARVRFAGRFFRTDRSGRARLTVRFRGYGPRHARASSRGLRRGEAWVRVRRR